MKIRISNTKFIGNGGSGVAVKGDGDADINMDIDGCHFSGNKKDGLSLGQNVSLIEELGLPEDTSARELADLLRVLAATPADQRQTAVESSNAFRRWVARGVNAISLGSNLVTIASQPNVSEIISQLL